MGIRLEKERYKIRIGSLPEGEKNLITDVPGLRVGHCTLIDEERHIQTGVTALIPGDGDIFHNKYMAACHVINGFGKSTGLVQVRELGQLETPILLTNTLSVGTAYEALVEYMLESNLDICETTGSVNPVICECNDMGCNDIRGLHIRKKHIFEALASAEADFAEGCVGAGRGMRCHGLKGGIGSASRMIEVDGKTCTFGAMVLANHGRYRNLRIDGKTVEELKARRYSEEASELQGSNESDKGSVIVLLATDCPLNERQLERVCRRAAAGLAKNGSFYGNGSGDIVIAFTTSNRIPHESEQAVLTMQMIHEDEIDLLFEACVESVEEAVLSALFHATPVPARRGGMVPTLTEVLELSDNSCYDKAKHL